MAEIALRPAIPADSEAIRLCITQAYATAMQEIPDLPDVTDGIAEDIENHHVTVAVDQQRILGVVIYDVTPDAVMIFNLAVSPDAQGRGVARRLLLNAESFAKTQNLANLRLRTHKQMHDTRSMYRHLGWVDVDETERAVLLEKPVDAKTCSGA